jgi:hypothetical protein
MFSILAVITEGSGSGVPPEVGELGSSLATSGSALLLFKTLILDPIFKHCDRWTDLFEKVVDAYIQSVDNQRGKIG